MIFFNIVWLHINFDQIYGTITIFLLPSQHGASILRSYTVYFKAASPHAEDSHENANRAKTVH